MIDAPPLPISAETYAAIARAGELLGMDSREWEHLEPSG